MKKKFFKLSLVLGYMMMSNVYGQVGIPTNNPNKDAVLDLNRTDGTSAKGLLLPNVALTSTDNSAPMTAHVAGMHVWNTASTTGTNAVTPGEYYNDGGKWIRVASNDNAWLQDGNANGSIKAIGTNDNFDLPIETNGTEKMRVTSSGNIGIGTVTPASRLEIRSGTTNKSGLKFSDLNASTPVSAGATLGVDGSGNVVTVTGTSFSPASGIGSLTSSKTIAPGVTNPNLCSITLPTPGTYLITYTVRAQFETSGAATVGGAQPNTGQYGRAFLSTNGTLATLLPNTEILLAYVRNGNNAYGIGGGGNYAGVTTFTVVSGSQTIYLGVANATAIAGYIGTSDLTLYDDLNGRTNVSYVKITP